MHKLKNYLALIRFDKPIGTYLLIFPGLVSLLFAFEEDIDFILIAKFVIGSFIMRSAGCIINDIIDRKIDAKVERTKSRPLASGALSLKNALTLLFILLLVGLLILITLRPITIISGMFILIPIAIYPLMKRITYWPQLFLAFTFNFGVIMASLEVNGNISADAIILYIAFIFWTLGYDTIYAHQDKYDDVRVGVKSTALRLGNKTRIYLSVFYLITLIMIILAGLVSGISYAFYLVMLFAAIQLFWQLYTLNIDNRSDCMKKFKSNQYFGVIVLIATIFGKFT